MAETRTPEQRAETARLAVEAYEPAAGGSMTEMITDLMADLMHLAASEGAYPDEIMTLAHSHYVYESLGGRATRLPAHPPS